MKTIVKTQFLTWVLLLVSFPSSAAEYQFDIEGMHAAIQFRIKHLGYSWLAGRFNDFNGSFVYDPGSPEKASVVVSINPASIDSNHAKRDKHLRDKDFLYVSKYPEAGFKSTRVEIDDGGSLAITGDLTLRGVTREIVIRANKVGSGPDPWGGFRLGFSGSTTLVLKDFGMVKSLGPATKEVELILNIEGVRQGGRKPGKP